MQRLTVSGVEFMIAISAPFYCQLCHCYSATIDEAQWHLLSANHNDKYKVSLLLTLRLYCFFEMSVCL